MHMTIVCGTLPGIQWAIYFPVGAMIMLRDFGVETGLAILPVIDTTVDSFKVMVINILVLPVVDSRCLNLQYLDLLLVQFLALVLQCILMDLITGNRGHLFQGFHLARLRCHQVLIHLFCLVGSINTINRCLSSNILNFGHHLQTCLSCSHQGICLHINKDLDHHFLSFHRCQVPCQGHHQ